MLSSRESIGRRVAAARKLRGLTQDGLALLVPCSKSLVSQVERRFKPATPWFVAAVARALHTDVPQLLGQPHRGTTERSDRRHASIPQIRIVMNYWDVPPDVEVTPRPLAAVRDDVAKVGGYLDTVNYSQLCAILPGLIGELSAIYHDSPPSGRRFPAELLMYAFIAAKSLAYRLGYTDLVAVAVELDDADEAIRRCEGFAPPPALPAERSSHHYIDLARAQLMAGQRDGSFRSLAQADRLAPQHTRHHPTARETVTGLIPAHARVPEPLRSMARRMSIAA